MEIEGRTALLTGATGGLGRAIAEALAGRGARLALSSRKEAELDELAASLAGSGHVTLPRDLADAGVAEGIVAEAEQALGAPVDILVANAALPGTGRIESYSEEQIQRVLRINLEAPILQARALGPEMARRGEGAIVMIASLAAKAATPRSAMYNATKFGLRGFAHAIRHDFAGTGVSVSLVNPGFVRDAGMFHDSGSKTPPGMGTTTPQAVAEGVVKAITTGRQEVDVAPLVSRRVAHFAQSFPGIASRFQKVGNAKHYAEQLAKGQTDKR